MRVRRILRGLPINNNEREYEVEDIVRYDEERDLYLVKWKGYLAKTFEPIEHLKNCMALVNRRRKEQKLPLLPHSGSQLCGASKQDRAPLNPSNWVSLEKIRDKIKQVQHERYPQKKVDIKIGRPQHEPKSTRVYIFCEMNHSFGIFYRREDRTGYIYDSDNIFGSSHPANEKLRLFEASMRLKPIKYNYRSRNDFCGSQMVVATIELLSWHHKGLMPAEVKPSPAVRKRIERIFHKQPSAKESRLGIKQYQNLRRIQCPICKKLIKRKGNNTHLIACQRRRKNN